ncbi:MAG: toll/interleukin-1 receptor domain-containing protein [Gammaproteobacteria bacterium]|nr:toll/interleukin-1 receptor domain-containing protein [Gammaproteobacteria bacterium]
MMTGHGVFLSYRRTDTSGYAGRISDDLARRYGRAVAFRDIDSIDAGADFVEALAQAMAAARVCLVLIGDTWLNAKGDRGERRLDRPDDHVRHEVEMALRQPGMVVIPVLLEGARMPDEDELPVSIRQLARLQAVELSESRWDYDMSRLATVLGQAGIVAGGASHRPYRWLAVLAVCAAMVVAGLLWWARGSDDAVDYVGLWYLPNGNYWSVRQRDGQLWVEESHRDSHEVWKRGPGTLDGDQFEVTLALVFEQKDFRYVHRLTLSADRLSLIGGVRRSDRQSEQSLVLTRDKR